uniref:Uncharacterized protein n=1 Tax=Solanum tuberosum TaxID=4113 RepID=M1E0P8_SOLTU
MALRNQIRPKNKRKEFRNGRLKCLKEDSSLVLRPIAPTNEPVEDPRARGRSRGRGRRRGRGQGRVAPARSGALVENALREEVPSAPQEEVQGNAEIEDEEDVGPEGDV